ncbi:MAG: hypothetical protein ABR936_10620 [Bacteroidota bacterium]|jgi:Tol biopolymer transport system component
MNKKLALVILKVVFSLMIITYYGYSQTSNAPINYFGQTPPGTTPIIFAPGIISLDDRFEGRAAFSPDGKEFYFTVTNEKFSGQKILFCKYMNGKWTRPDTPSFSKTYSNHEPFFSFDGKKLYFTSDRDSRTKDNKRDLFYVNRLNDGWSEPIKLNPPINSDYRELYFCQSRNGTVYFASNRPGGNGSSDIYFITSNKGKYDILQNLGSKINKGYTVDPCISPDESYIIFASMRGWFKWNTDLYISFKKDGTWTEPVAMRDFINTGADEYAPFLSPDGNYLFFVRHDGKRCDIYWVDASVINKYRNN